MKNFHFDSLLLLRKFNLSLGEKEKDGAYWYKLLTSRESRTHKTSYERLHVLEFDSNRKVCLDLLTQFQL